MLSVLSYSVLINTANDGIYPFLYTVVIWRHATVNHRETMSKESKWETGDKHQDKDVIETFRKIDSLR